MTEGILVKRLERRAEAALDAEAAEDAALASMQKHVDDTRRTVSTIREQLELARGIGTGEQAVESKQREDRVREAASRARQRRQSKK